MLKVVKEDKRKGRLNEEKERNAVCNSFAQIMQRIKLAVGDPSYLELVRVSQEEVQKAAYEFDDVSFFRTSLVTLRNEIENKLLGKGVNNNVFEAIGDIKNELGKLI